MPVRPKWREQCISAGVGAMDMGSIYIWGGRCMPQIEMCVNTERNSGLCVHRGAGRRERRARGKEMGMLDVCLEV